MLHQINIRALLRNVCEMVKHFKKMPRNLNVPESTSTPLLTSFAFCTNLSLLESVSTKTNTNVITHNWRHWKNFSTFLGNMWIFPLSTPIWWTGNYLIIHHPFIWLQPYFGWRGRGRWTDWGRRLPSRAGIGQLECGGKELKKKIINQCNQNIGNRYVTIVNIMVNQAACDWLRTNCSVVKQSVMRLLFACLRLIPAKQTCLMKRCWIKLTLRLRKTLSRRPWSPFTAAAAVRTWTTCNHPRPR